MSDEGHTLQKSFLFLLMLAVTATEEPGGVLDGVIRGHRCNLPLFADSDEPQEDLLWKQNLILFCRLKRKVLLNLLQSPGTEKFPKR